MTQDDQPMVFTKSGEKFSTLAEAIERCNDDEVVFMVGATSDCWEWSPSGGWIQRARLGINGS